ncbi:MAG: DUF378 domain-containing protein [Candidatus Paceibacterota bacterium]|jgi:hypothetical protein
MNELNWLDWIVFILVIVGGLNWALVGIFNFDLVAAIFMPLSLLSRVVYVLVGIAAVYLAVISPSLTKK